MGVKGSSPHPAVSSLPALPSCPTGVSGAAAGCGGSVAIYEAHAPRPASPPSHSDAAAPIATYDESR